MGLDMYFTREPKTKSSKDAYRYRHEVGYFRKHNALHQWMVDNVQDGVDECQKVVVSFDVLSQLLILVQAALALRDASIIPPAGGFFFGSTDVDEMYWTKMSDTYETLQDIINTTDFDNESIFYQSSW